MIRPLPRSTPADTLFPDTTLFRSRGPGRRLAELHMQDGPPLRRQPVGFPADSDGLKRIDIGNHAPPLTRPATLSQLPRWTWVNETILDALDRKSTRLNSSN